MEGVPVPRRDSAPGGKPRPPGSPYLLRPTPGLTGHTSEGHLVMRGPWKSSPQLPLSELTVPPLQFQNIQQNHLETGLKWGSGEAGRRGAGRLELGWGWCWSGEAGSWVSLSEDSACSPFRSHCGGSALPTTADNRIFNDYDYHLNNWKLPQIIKMRFGSSLPISPLSFKPDGNFTAHLETRATEDILAERRLGGECGCGCTTGDERHTCVHVCIVHMSVHELVCACVTMYLCACAMIGEKGVRGQAAPHMAEHRRWGQVTKAGLRVLESG